MLATLSALGSSVVSGIVSFFSNKAVKVATSISLLIVLLSIIPFNIALPDEFVEMFSPEGSIYSIFVSMNYFLPVGFLINCFLIIFLLKYTHFFWGLFQRIHDWFVK